MKIPLRVAFDVKGTIEGPKKALVLKLFKGLQDKGHKCFVWSNSMDFAVDAIIENNLKNTEAMHKWSKSDFKDVGALLMDICIEDDRSQTWLGTKRFIFVDELDEALVDSLLLTA